MPVQRRSMPACRASTVTRDSLSLATGRKRQLNAYVPDVRETDEIDPEQWAKLLEALLRAANLTPEAAAQPAGPVPATWRTIRKWLSGESGVSARKVRDVTRSLGYPPVRALVEVGWLQHTEVGVTGLAAPPSASSDGLVRKIAAALADQRIPTPVRSVLRRLLQGAYDGWLDMHQAKAPKDIVDRPAKTVRPTKAR